MASTDYCTRGHCRACAKGPVYLCRGSLCQACHVAAARGPYPDFGGPARPTTPTDAPPRSKAKVDVLAGRAERGEELFSPLDAPDFDMAAHRRRRQPGRRKAV